MKTYKAIYEDMLGWAEHWSKYKAPGETLTDKGWRFAAQEVLQTLKTSRSKSSEGGKDG